MIKQIAVFVENQKGMIRKITAVLRENGICICGLSTVDSPEFGIVRMIVDYPSTAKEQLERAGFIARECEVIAVELDRQENLESLLQVLQDGNVNINYFYSSFGEKGRDPILVLHVSDMDETEEMLRGHGFRCADDINKERE